MWHKSLVLFLRHVGPEATHGLHLYFVVQTLPAFLPNESTSREDCSSSREEKAKARIGWWESHHNRAFVFRREV